MTNEFDEIRPYEKGEMKQAFEELLADRQFSTLLKGFVPWLPKSIRNGLLRLAFTGVETPLDFQLRFMKPIVWYFVRKYSDGLTFDDSQLSTLNSQLSTQITVGLSGINYALMALIIPQVAQPRPYVLTVLAYILVGFLFPNCNNLLHLYCFLLALPFCLLRPCRNDNTPPP